MPAGIWKCYRLRYQNFKGVDFDLSVLGFDEAELSKLMGDIEDVKDDDFDVDEELKKPEAVTKVGDLWLLGNHRLICGDSTKNRHFYSLDGRKASKSCCNRSTL